MRASSRPALFLPFVCALVVAAWCAIAWWGQSPAARYLHPFDWADVSPLAQLCRVLPGGAAATAAALYSLAWLLMVVAMMLPTAFPLLVAFRRLTAGNARQASLVACLVAGYLGAWLLFGAVVAAVDTALHALAAASGWLLANGEVLGAVVLAGAGAYQFSALKYACLDRCRSPLSFVTEGWRGVDPVGDSLRIGLRHGLFCVGCCWSLMVVMFVVGSGSLGWMLGLAAVMALEKNVAWGRRLAPVIGAVLLASAALLATRRLGLV